MVNVDTYRMSETGMDSYNRRIPPKARKIIDSIETIAETYLQEYTGPGGEEESGLSTIIELVKRLRCEL